MYIAIDGKKCSFCVYCADISTVHIVYTIADKQGLYAQLVSTAHAKNYYTIMNFDTFMEVYFRCLNKK